MKACVLSFALLTLVTGVLYPLAVTGVAQLVFPREANGDATLVAQPSASPRELWPRPSATSPPYNASGSGGSNLGPTNPALRERIEKDKALLASAHPGAGDPPADLLTTSGSGLDPHISPEAARYQAARVAAARGLDLASVQRVIDEQTEGRWLGLFGEPRVNVVRVNLALESKRQ